MARLLPAVRPAPPAGSSGSAARNGAEPAGDATGGESGATMKLGADLSSDLDGAELARRHSSRLLGIAGVGQLLEVAGPGGAGRRPASSGVTRRHERPVTPSRCELRAVHA